MPIYRTTGTLTSTILPENVSDAQDYLQSDDMTQYLDPEFIGVVERITWYLDNDGHNYYVEAICSRRLTKPERKSLGSWISGQNSDGLGEGFEQQEFAEEYADDDSEDSEAYAGMISFDWKTNKSKVVRVGTVGDGL